MRRFTRRWTWGTQATAPLDGHYGDQEAAGPQINIVLNWIEELKELVPVLR